VALITRLPASNAANAAARALEVLLGHDVMIATGEVIITSPAEVLPGGDTRSVALPFGNGIVGEVTLVVASHFATAMAAATPDASLVTAALPALKAAADAIEPVIHLQAVADYAGEIATDTLLTSVVGDFAIVPLAEGEAAVGFVVVRVVDDEPAPAPTPIAPPAVEAAAPPVTIALPSVASASSAPSTASAPVGTIAMHEFQPLADGGVTLGAPRPLPLLNDVEMEIIAELGRMRMKVKDLVALEPGSVIELDRAAGSPVDVLVNGALIAHGEVVVIDEEFGIRLSEIVVGEN
jgi:flagellar motor switch protein FliN/FliY